MTLLKMSIYGAVIILAIILIRAFTLHKLPKKTFLILWSVALLRLLVPFEIASEYSVYSLLPKELTEQFSGETVAAKESTEIKTLEEAIQNLKNAESEEVSSASSDNNAGLNDNTDNPIYLPIEDLDTDAIQLPNAEPDSLSKLPMDTVREKPTPTISELFLDNFLTVIWATGTLLSAAFFLISYLRCYAEFRTALPVTNEYARDFLRHHWTNRIIRLRQSDRISAPLTYGIFRPVILLPKKMDWENHSRIDYILYHEFTHIRRFDLVPKLLMTAALCIHWFNPLVWAMYYLFNRDIELSCDECVVTYYENDNTKADYARTLISMEEKKSHLTPLCNNFSKNAIQERITSIMKFKQTTTGMLFAGIVIVAAVVITLATSASTKTEGAETGLTPTDIPAADTPLWQTVARDAIGMLYGGDGNAYKIAEQDDGLLSLADFASQNLTIDLSAYSTDREWLENGVFYDEEQLCCYVVYSLSPNTEVTEGPCVLLVTIPADQPESYTVFPLGDAGEPSLTYSWTRHPVKIGTNIYLNNQHPFQNMWYIDTVTGKLHSLAYVNEALNTKAAAYLSSQGLEADCTTVCGIAGQMGNHIVYYAEAGLSTDLSSPDFTVYLVYHNNRVVGEQPLVAEYIEEHTH